MNTFLRAPTLEMPHDVLDDLRNRAAADEDRATAKLGPFADPAAKTVRAGQTTPHFSINLRVPAPRPASVTPAAVTPAAGDSRPPQAGVPRAVVIGLSFAVTLALALGLALAL